jgi:hypothetical protein
MDGNAELDIETYREAAELRRIGNRAVRNAQAENRRLGIPNAYSRRGRLYFELPSGEITEDDPFEEIDHADEAS